MNTLAICRTCPRDTTETGNFGIALHELLKNELSGKAIEIMMVQCLGSCRMPGNVAFEAPDKTRIRLSGITLQDADWLLCAASNYVRTGDRLPDTELLPHALQLKISALAPKPARASKEHE
ncbi:MAG: DUF1636 family protein [Woeseia sp.]